MMCAFFRKEDKRILWIEYRGPLPGDETIEDDVVDEVCQSAKAVDVCQLEREDENCQSEWDDEDRQPEWEDDSGPPSDDEWDNEEVDDWDKPAIAVYFEGNQNTSELSKGVLLSAWTRNTIEIRNTRYETKLCGKRKGEIWSLTVSEMNDRQIFCEDVFNLEDPETLQVWICNTQEDYECSWKM
jgi:hypothetical protein